MPLRAYVRSILAEAARQPLPPGLIIDFDTNHRMSDDMLVAVDIWLDGGPWPIGVTVRDGFSTLIDRGEVDPSVMHAVLRSIERRDAPLRVRYQVAKSSKTPPHILTVLADDDDRWVRNQVIANPSSPSEAIDIIAINSEDREFPIVQGSLASHRSITRRGLEALANSKNYVVAQRAQDRLSSFSGNA